MENMYWDGMLTFIVVAGLAQSVERQALNLVVVGSSPTAGEFCAIESMVALLVINNQGL